MRADAHALEQGDVELGVDPSVEVPAGRRDSPLAFQHAQMLGGHAEALCRFTDVYYLIHQGWMVVLGLQVSWLKPGPVSARVRKSVLPSLYVFFNNTSILPTIPLGYFFISTAVLVKPGTFDIN